LFATLDNFNTRREELATLAGGHSATEAIAADLSSIKQLTEEAGEGIRERGGENYPCHPV